MAKNDPTPVATKRPRKTRAEKAVAELDAAIKTRDLAQKKLDKLKEGLQPAQAAFDFAEAEVQFLQQNPALPDDRRVVVPNDASTLAPGESDDEHAYSDGRSGTIG